MNFNPIKLLEPIRRAARVLLGFRRVTCLVGCVCLAFSVWFAGANSAGDEVVGEKQVGQKKVDLELVDRLIEQLGDRSFRIRESATRKLWRQGTAAIGPLKKAAKSRSREVTKRAEWLLERLEYGILPSTSPALVPLIRRYREEPANRSRIIREIAKFGESAVPTLRNLQRVETDRELLKQLAHLARSFTVQRMWQAIRNGKLEDAESHLRLVSRDPDMHRSFAAFFAVQDRLDVVIPELKSEYQKTQDRIIGRQLVYSLRAAGRLDEALKIGRLLDDEQLLVGLLFEGGRWRELANRRAALPRRNRVTDQNYSRPLVEYRGFLAGCLRLSGNSTDSTRLLDDLIGAVRARRSITGYRTFAQDAARVLLINDRPNSAIDLIADHAQSMPYNAHLAFELLCTQDRFDEAFEFANKFISNKYRGYDRLERERLLRLNSLGEHDRAKTMLLDSFDEALKAKSKQRSINAAIGLLSIGAIEEGIEANLKLVDSAKIASRDRKEWDVIFARSLNKPSDSNAASIPKWIASGVKSRRAILLTMLLEVYKEDSPSTLIARARFLIGLPSIDRKEIGPQTDATIVAMVERLAAKARTYQNYAIGKSMEGLAFTCFRIGEFDRGREFLREGIKLGGQAAKLPIADSYAEQKNWTAANEAYHSVAGLTFSNFAQGWCLTQLSKEAKEPAAKMLLAKDGRKKMQLATLQFLDRTSSRRSGITRLVSERGWKSAETKLVTLTRQTEEFGSVHLINAYGTQGNEASHKKQLQQAIDGWERNRLSTLDLSTIISTYTQLLTEPFTMNRVRARLLFSQGRTDDGIEALNKSHAALPGREDIVIEYVPVLRKLGRRPVADALLRSVYQHNHHVCVQFPKSLKHRRRLVKLSVTFDWRLNDGLKHAQAALELAPGDGELVRSLTGLKDKIAKLKN
jgi:hypothetical protein